MYRIAARLTSTSVKPGVVLVLLVLMLSLGACNESKPDSDPPDQGVLDTGDVPEDESSDSTPSDLSDADTTKAGFDERCTTSTECQRGLMCVDTCDLSGTCTERCIELSLCNPEFLMDGEGCIAESAAAAGRKRTAAECAEDVDCEDSMWGSRCVANVCTDATPCTTDAECSGNEVCLWESICVPPE